MPFDIMPRHELMLSIDAATMITIFYCMFSLR